MNTLLRPVIPAMVVFLCEWQLAGCTAIGYVIGSSIDQANTKSEPVSVKNIDELPRDVELSVLMADGRVITGSYQGVAVDPSADYRVKYKEFRSTPAFGEFLPALGDTVVVIQSGPQPHRKVGDLWGFSPDAIWIRTHNIGRNTASSVIESHALNEADTIADLRGRTLAAKQVLGLIAEGMLPTLRPQVYIVVDRSSTPVPCDSIEQITMRRINSTGRTIGAVTGSAIDIAVIAVLIANWRGIGMGPGI